MTFEKPDLLTFEGLDLAYKAAEIGGSMPTVYNAANEKSVSLFLERRISYLEITQLIKDAMKHHNKIENPNLEEILKVEKEVYQYINEVVGK